MDRRKQLKQAYREQKEVLAVCQVRNLRSGKVYLESGATPEALLNRSLFMLRQNSHFSTELQRDWSLQDGRDFEFSVLEVLKPGSDSHDLKVAERSWRERSDCY